MLVDKSPRNMLMMRLLQHWFGPDHTFFIVVLRHPLGSRFGVCMPLTAGSDDARVVGEGQVEL